MSTFGINNCEIGQFSGKGNNVQINQTNNNTGNVNNRIELDTPADGAVVLTVDRELSAADVVRLRIQWEDAIKHERPIVLDGSVRAFQVIDGELIEIGCEPTSTDSQRFTALLAVALAIVTTILFAVLTR